MKEQVHWKYISAPQDNLAWPIVSYLSCTTNSISWVLKGYIVNNIYEGAMKIGFQHSFKVWAGGMWTYFTELPTTHVIPFLKKGPIQTLSIVTNPFPIPLNLLEVVPIISLKTSFLIILSKKDSGQIWQSWNMTASADTKFHQTRARRERILMILQ